ncbi:DnaB-like helicase N-terminal domain-containing protein [Streptantibioticus ferralitis]|uniref:DnaB-like helicase N-terminal domain-containing protein n=1 Tax=Streptantibioticus ferralitis TaxID=236510 RepID=A0ABT5YRY6_9ACTN|nr:DnaB-like helicase N-terminal domain-containing protein [Streptantibioticus ferralitis]MDF2254346.1 DnaB-like helicase N-terminal domain-containing protein [Streptantibioticus ferralitis]
MNVLIEAEQAVLGAVLLDPGQLDSLAGWLSPDHFFRPAHQAVFAAMLTLRSRGHSALTAKGEVPLAWVTDTFAEAARSIRGLTPSYAHTLVAACPRAGNAPVYGRMVLEGAIHRSVLEHATRLRQVAHTDALQGVADNTVGHVQILNNVLDDLSRRWGTDPKPLPPPNHFDHSSTAAIASSDEQAEDEQLLIGLLIDRPDGMRQVVEWLRPADFANPICGDLYRCIGALHHRSEPIDALTVQWEAQRRGLFADCTLSADQVGVICRSGGAGSPEFLGERVMASSLVRTASASAHMIQELARDESLAPGRLIGYALHALIPAHEVHERWRTAINAAPVGSAAPAANTERSTERVHAALARSQPQRPSPPPTRTPATTIPSTRPAARSHT